MKISKAILFLLILFLPLNISAETKQWRVYNYVTDLAVQKIGFTKAPANVLIERRGLVDYGDGEVASFLTYATAQLTPKSGKAEGYSQYTFDDGSTQVYKWNLKSWKEKGAKLKSVGGTGTYISGTGRFAGITGDLTLKGRYITPYSEEAGTLGDMVVDITANYSLPK